MSVLKLSMSIFYCNFFCCFSKNVVVGKVIYFVTHDHRLRMPYKAFISLKSISLGFGQTNQADKFWSIWGIFSRTRCQNPFWHSESLVYVFHYSTKISTKNQTFISTSQISIRDWDLNLSCKELGIQFSCVHSPCSRRHEIKEQQRRLAMLEELMQ